jgi:peptidyl-prolyl cis-trans isomerase C
MRRYSRTKNSTKIFIAATIVAALAFGSFQFFSCCGYSGEVVAKVNGQRIYRSQVKHKLALLLGGSPNQDLELPKIEALPKEVIEILSKEIYLDVELAKIARKSNAAKSSEVKDRIKEVTNDIIRQAYIDDIVFNEVTEEVISQKYSELSSELQNKKEYEIAHIVVETEEAAKKISRDLSRRRFSFSRAAKKYSLDKESANDGGKLGFVLESNLIKEIADQITQLKRNRVSDPIKTRFGWHLVVFSEVRDAKALPFAEVKDNIRQQLIKDILDRTKANITKDIEVRILVKEKKEEEVKEVTQKKSKSELISPLDDAASEEKSETNPNAPSKKSSK